MASINNPRPSVLNLLRKDMAEDPPSPSCNLSRRGAGEAPGSPQSKLPPRLAALRMEAGSPRSPSKLNPGRARGGSGDSSPRSKLTTPMSRLLMEMDDEQKESRSSSPSPDSVMARDFVMVNSTNEDKGEKLDPSKVKEKLEEVVNAQAEASAEAFVRFIFEETFQACKTKDADRIDALFEHQIKPGAVNINNTSMYGLKQFPFTAEATKKLYINPPIKGAEPVNAVVCDLLAIDSIQILGGGTTAAVEVTSWEENYFGLDWKINEGIHKHSMILEKQNDGKWLLAHYHKSAVNRTDRANGYEPETYVEEAAARRSSIHDLYSDDRQWPSMM